MQTGRRKRTAPRAYHIQKGAVSMGDISTCKNIFQNGTDAPEPEQFTLAWIQLINEMERAKTFPAETQTARQT